MDKPKILVIDDEKGLRDMLVYSLESRGYAVATAENGLRAVEMARIEPFDLAICDLMMPEMGGIETLKRLKELRPSIEVVMATGYATLENAVEAMKMGAYDYVSKPYEMDQMCVVLEKALERGRLKAKVGELEQISKLKSEFLANMSHELRTPLNAIVGYSSLIIDGIYGEVPAAQADALNRVLSNSKSLLTLINNILDFSKLNAGMMPTHVEEFDAAAVAREVVDMMLCLAQEKKLFLEVRAASEVPVFTDKTKFKQILVNLVGNAIKFTAEGGVTVAVGFAPEAKALRVAVRDTGPGIAPEDVPSVFQEFKQLDGAATRKHGGTGLGLSITKKLAELLGGGVTVESTLGKGTTFAVTLDGAVAAKDALVPASEPDASKRLLLAIDDDPEVLRLLHDSLRGTGYAFVGATSGEEGLALARKLKPFVVTLDVMMPHRDGWSVLQALKNDPELRAIPVIMLTIMENKALGFSLGIADYIVKPFQRAELLEKLGGLEIVSGKRVLVVDDDEDIRGMIQLGLKNEGYDVDSASTGKAALAKITENPPDVLFLDLNLPDMSGFDILGKIENTGKDMRIIVLTGQSLDAEQTAALEVRAERVINKGSISLTAILDSLKEKLLAMAEAK